MPGGEPRMGSSEAKTQEKPRLRLNWNCSATVHSIDVRPGRRARRSTDIGRALRPNMSGLRVASGSEATTNQRARCG